LPSAEPRGSACRSAGGWVSGVIFDATGSYAAAFANGVAWTALNIGIMAALLLRARLRPVPVLSVG
jgi:hypothetical protein